MRLQYILKTSITGLSTHKSRSGLTILGIVIAISSVILMVSLGDGAERLVLKEIAGFGAETIVVRPGKEPTGPTDIGDTLFSDSLKERDVKALQRTENVPELVAIMPAILVPGAVSFEGETMRPTIFGGSAEFFSEAFNIFPEEGELFTEDDIKQGARVAVIGLNVKEELFGDDTALNKQIRIKEEKFKVVGVFPDKGQGSLVDYNDLVIVPYTTAQKSLLGIRHFHEIILKASSPDAVNRTVQDVEATLRELHNITDPAKDDFFVVTQQGAIDQISSIINTLTLFLASVVAIALVVGGVGVMNVMLVSVTERTREIGLRKALGATNEDIRNQFLIEAMILTGLGGIIGVTIGAFLGFLVSFMLTTYAGIVWGFTFPIGAAILGFGVSVFVGLIFGIYPAQKASQKSPIEALRYE